MRERRGVRRVRVRRSHCVQAESCESHTGAKLQVAHGKISGVSDKSLLLQLCKMRPV